MIDREGWFSDVDPDDETGYAWQPCIQTDAGSVPSLSVWFATEADCDAFIRDYVLGRGMIDGDSGAKR